MARCASFEKVQTVSLFPEDLLLRSDSCCLQRMQLVYYVVYNNMLTVFGDNYTEILWSWSFWSLHACCQKGV
jgi:hypothetical protein